MAKFWFSTRYFRFSEEGIQVLRSNFPYKEIAFSEVRLVQIKKGVSTKRPFLTFAFGMLLISLSIAVSLPLIECFTQPTTFGETAMYHRGIRAIGAFSLMSFFLFAMGVASLYVSMFPVWVLPLETVKGCREVFAVGQILKEKNAKHFFQFLHLKLKPWQLCIDDQIRLSKYSEKH